MLGRVPTKCVLPIKMASQCAGIDSNESENIVMHDVNIEENFSSVATFISRLDHRLRTRVLIMKETKKTLEVMIIFR